MATTTIVQHKSIDPNHLLTQILNAPLIFETTPESFRVKCSSINRLEGLFKGKKLAYNKQIILVAGEVHGIIIYAENMIAAQYIHCDIPGKTLSSILLSKTPSEKEVILSKLGLSDADFILIK